MTGLRVLQIAHDHPLWTSGGTEIVAHDLARALAARDGIASHLLVAATRLQRPDAAPGSLGSLGEDFVLATGSYDRFSMLRLDGDAWIGSLARVLETVQPDVVHLHGLDRLGAEIVPALRRLAPRIRIVLTLHDYQLICPNDGLLLTVPDGARCAGSHPDRCRRCFPEIAAARHALRQVHLQAILRGVDRILAPSSFLRERFVDWGIEASRICVVPNAVSGPARRTGAARPRPDRFAFFGNIARHKGVLVLLDAAARTAAAGSSLRVNIHGGLGWADEAFRSDFHAKLAAAGAAAQHLGPYDRAEVTGLMQQSDWIVVPSVWWENAPLVIEEARAAGRPVIASGIGGMAEMVEHGRDGLHVPPGDASALAETLMAAAEAPDLWQRLAGGAEAARASFAQHVDAHEVLYRDLIQRAAA